MADFDDIEANLRLFAMRKAASEQHHAVGQHGATVTTSKRTVVSVNASPSPGCPMHGKDGTYQLPERNSRKEMARELRLSVAREEAASRRSSSYSEYGNYSRSQSLEPGYHSHSVPRRMSAQAATKNRNHIDRKGSFQEYQPPPQTQHQPKPVPRDVFKGKIDFKTILRRFDPKDDERAAGGGNERDHRSSSHSRMSRSREGLLSDSREMLSPRRGMIIESDFDFRGGASRETNWDNPGRFRKEQHQPPTTRLSRSRPQNLQIDVSSRVRSPDHSLRRSESNPISPRHYPESNPISPRRVEFGQEVVFDFNPKQSSRSNVVSPTPGSSHHAPGGGKHLPYKPILRHTTSDPGRKSPQSAGPLPEQGGGSLMDQYQQKLLQQKLDGISSSSSSPSPQPAISPLTIQHANQDFASLREGGHQEYGFQADHHHQKQSASNGSSGGEGLIQIYVPQMNNPSNLVNGGRENSSRKSSSQQEEHHSDNEADSDSTIEDKSVGLSGLRDAENGHHHRAGRHLEGSSLSRKTPPSLGDWQHRSQSFPSPATPAETDEALAGILRKSSLPEKGNSDGGGQQQNSRAGGENYQQRGSNNSEAATARRKGSRKRKWITQGSLLLLILGWKNNTWVRNIDLYQR